MSYNLFGWKWGAADAGSESGTIYWTGGVTSTDIRFDSAYDDGDFSAALLDAFQSWEDESGLDFEYTTNSAIADITVGAATYAGSKVGEASWSNFGRAGDYDGVSTASIRFDTLEADSASQDWAPYGAGGLDFYSVALHEIGHTIGMDHVMDSSEIMNGSVSADALGDGDILGAQVLYGTATAGPGPDPEPEPEPDPEPPVVDGPGGNIFAKIFGILGDFFTSFFGGGSSSGTVVNRLLDEIGGDETTVHDHLDEQDYLDDGEEIFVVHDIYIDDLPPMIAVAENEFFDDELASDDEDFVFL